MKPLPPGLAPRDALHDFDHVASRLVAEGRDTAAPFVTVAIPTFRRPDLLAEAVASILAQDFGRKIEIVVVDNDPDSTGADALLAALPALETAAFRYYVNAANIGMYPNHNRALTLARGTWVSILNDDDLLLPDCLSSLFAVLDAHPRITAIQSRKRWLDEREGAEPGGAEPGAAGGGRLHARIAYGLLRESYYLGRAWRRIHAGRLFWGNSVGNLAGFVVRRETALALGGFQPEDEWSADYWFQIRIAAGGCLAQHRRELALVRRGRNESMKPEVLRSFVNQGARTRTALLGTKAPRWYRVFEPWLLAREQADYKRFWNVALPLDELERHFGTRIVHRPIATKLARLLLRGF